MGEQFSDLTSEQTHLVSSLIKEVNSEWIQRNEKPAPHSDFEAAILSRNFKIESEGLISPFHPQYLINFMEQGVPRGILPTLEEIKDLTDYKQINQMQPHDKFKTLGEIFGPLHTNFIPTLDLAFRLNIFLQDLGSEKVAEVSYTHGGLARNLVQIATIYDDGRFLNGCKHYEGSIGNKPNTVFGDFKYFGEQDKPDTVIFSFLSPDKEDLWNALKLPTVNNVLFFDMQDSNLATSTLVDCNPTNLGRYAFGITTKFKPGPVGVDAYLMTK